MTKEEFLKKLGDDMHEFIVDGAMDGTLDEVDVESEYLFEAFLNWMARRFDPEGNLKVEYNYGGVYDEEGAYTGYVTSTDPDENRWSELTDDLEDTYTRALDTIGNVSLQDETTSRLTELGVFVNDLWDAVL